MDEPLINPTPDFDPMAPETHGWGGAVTGIGPGLVAGLFMAVVHGILALGGGGSLMDLGIYPLNAIRFLVRGVAGGEPTAFTAQVATTDHESGRFKEVEQSLVWTMQWKSGLQAACSSSYGQRGLGFLDVHAEKGWLRFEPAYYYDGSRLTGMVGEHKIDMGPGGQAPFQFALEADHFSDCIRNNRQPKSPGEDGLGDLLAIESIYKAAGTPIA